MGNSWNLENHHFQFQNTKTRALDQLDNKIPRHLQNIQRSFKKRRG